MVKFSCVRYMENLLSYNSILKSRDVLVESSVLLPLSAYKTSHTGSL
jgi:hypothetical protein